MIVLEQLAKVYGDAASGACVLRDVSWSAAAGESVALLGPSGSGKSTLLHILGLLDQPTSGRYMLDGQDTAALDANARAALRNRHVGFVFQSFMLLPRLTVYENVALPLHHAQGALGFDGDARVHACLAAVGLADCLTKYPTQLSGGQQQRVGVARAMVMRPALWLADEPTGALDQKTGAGILDLLLGASSGQGACVVVVTHDVAVAARCDRQVHLCDGVLLPAETSP